MLQFEILNNNKKTLKQKVSNKKYNSHHSEHLVKH